MNLTPKIRKAMAKAAFLHKEQLRLDDVPYICHPISVAIILSNYTDNEDIIIGGLLHDTIEDTSYTVDELKKDFGKKITDIVLGVTFSQIEETPETWRRRCKEYFKHLEKMNKESLLVTVADKIHNTTDMILGFEKLGQSFLDKFDPPSMKEDLEQEEKVLTVLKEKLGDIPIIKELEFAYKEFEEKIVNKVK